jgi:hypothetical protein
MFTLRDLFGDDERIDRKAFVFCFLASLGIAAP